MRWKNIHSGHILVCKHIIDQCGTLSDTLGYRATYKDELFRVS